MSRSKAGKRRNKREKRAVWVLFTLLGLLVLALMMKFSLDKVDSALYPEKYSEYVEKYAEKYQVDPFLIYAVIKTESGFQPDAKSEDNALGLMQITGDTFDWISSKLEKEDRGQVHEDLYDPEMNIRYGTFFLSYLLNEFEEWEVALAAYNAGRGITNQWLQDPAYSDDGKTLSHIPYGETSYYVDKVMGNYQQYQKMYGKEGSNPLQ
jgi:soluble lytic murein transglycosylase